MEGIAEEDTKEESAAGEEVAAADRMEGKKEGTKSVFEADMREDTMADSFAEDSSAAEDS